MRRSTLTYLVLILFGASRGLAVDYFWNDPNGGAYDEPSHWTPFSPPATQGPGGANDTINFDLGVSSITPYFVTDLSRENSQLIIHDDSLLLSIFVNYELSSAGAANPSVIVGASSGDDAFGSFFGGGVSTIDTQVVRIANAADSEGSIRIDALEWNSGNFRVGHAGDGVLTMDVDATLNSTNGSIAHLAGSTGHATVQGDWNVSGTFVVGRQGEATLEVSGGGAITSNSIVIGDQSSAVGDATVSSTMTAASSLTVGDSGRGSLLITGPFANVTSTDAFVGRQAGSNGVAVLANGTWSVNGSLSVGGDSVGMTAGGDGLLEMTGGSLNVAQGITLFPDGQISMVGGALDAPIIDMQSGASFDWAGGQLSVDTFNGSLLNFGGVLAARSGSNSILVSGEYAQGPAGVLDIKIDGPAAGFVFDSLTVGNTAFLGGILSVELAEGFQPDSEEVYVVLDALNMGAGSFDNVANGERLFLDLSAGSFLVHYGAESLFDPSQVVLTDFQPPATGDFDFDGDVDGRDFLIWQRGGSHNPLSAGDLAIWQERYNVAPLVATVTTIPEPFASALVLIALCSTAALRIR